MLSYLKSFVMQILPSVAATIIGAYIVNHYIVAKPGPDAPATAVSAAQSKADAKNTKPAKTTGDVASLPEAGVKAKGISEKGLLEKNAAAEKAVVEKPAEKAAADKPEEKAADKPAETASVPAEPRRHQPAKTESREKVEKTAVRIIPLTPQPAQPTAPAPVVAAPASVPSAEAAAAPEERRDANDLPAPRSIGCAAAKPRLARSRPLARRKRREIRKAPVSPMRRAR